MSTLKTQYFTLALIILSSAAHAQTQRDPGYYISKNGDSVLCQVMFKDWRVNPDAVSVIVNDEVQVWKPADIKGFGVDGYGNYKSATVSFHLNPIAGNNLPVAFSDETETKDCFLKVLVSGMYSLYELNTQQRPYYFVSRNDSAVDELIYRVKEQQLEVREDKRYRQTLFALFLREGISGQHLNTIERTPYKGAGLASLIRILNERYPGKTVVAFKPAAKRDQFEAAVFLGGVVNAFPSAVDGRFLRAKKFPNSNAPSGGINFVYFLPGHFKSFAIGLSVAYNSYSVSVSQSDSTHFYSSPAYYSNGAYTEQMTTKNSMLMHNLYGMYFINPRNHLKFYLKGGLNTNISLSKKNDLSVSHHFTGSGVANGVPSRPTDETGGYSVKMLKMFYNLNAGMGISSGRHKLELNYYSPVNLSMGGEFKLRMMSAYYYFSVFK